MNMLSFADFKERFAHRLRYRLRILDTARNISVFSRDQDVDALQRIYVINLDRKPDRWRHLQRELDRFRDKHGFPLLAITRRYSAVDARYLPAELDPSILHPIFTLADQLSVHPNPLLRIDDETRARQIEMTRQEAAVALSHIEVWRLIAYGDTPSALVLEDDIFMPVGFAKDLSSTWSSLVSSDGTHNFDLLYLAYREVSESKSARSSTPQRRVTPGIWEASGYVLSREGARKLLDRLPVHGPIDLWMNLQFADLLVYSSAKRLIEQRIDEPSTNSYSVLPVLSQVGAITREKPLVPTARRLVAPVLGVGRGGSGLTALAKALSMLGYTCVSDLVALPEDELARLRRGRKSRTFNAYVNIGSLDQITMQEITSANPGVRVIVTSPDTPIPGVRPEKLLRLGPEVDDHWAALCDYLGVEYPPFPYPDDDDLGQRWVTSPHPRANGSTAKDLKFDKSPWVSPEGPGISLKSSAAGAKTLVTPLRWNERDIPEDQNWWLRDDTFPSNLALFTAANFSRPPGEPARLTLRNEPTSVRQFTSAAIATRNSYLYGSFRAELRPSNVSGIITGLFLHRNGPRQEIDIEFLGKDTTKMLVNVFYNPGPTGTKLEYGYRGTPTLIDLGFDAADDFHTYEIDWEPTGIKWKVDGLVVYERSLWNPTPIPDQPLEFNLNLWHSRSTEFAGHLSNERIPTTTQIRSIEILSAARTAARVEHEIIASSGASRA
jgi:GR25 family glycosyltransferase involved in LPS biosynthesis